MHSYAHNGAGTREKIPASGNVVNWISGITVRHAILNVDNLPLKSRSRFPMENYIYIYFFLSRILIKRA